MGAAKRPRVQKVQRVRPAFGRLVQRVVVAASPQIIKKGRGSAAGCVEGLRKRVLKMDRPNGRRVLRFDGAFGPEGCCIALTGNTYKVSVTGLTFSVI